MKFLFEAQDAVCLPMAYKLIAEIKPFLNKIKNVEFEEGTENQDKKSLFLTVAQKIMVEYPEDTAKLLSKLWILEEKELPVTDSDGNPVRDEYGKPLTELRMEDAPNVFRTMAAICSSQTAIDFFASALPALLQISKGILPRLK